MTRSTPTKENPRPVAVASKSPDLASGCHVGRGGWRRRLLWLSVAAVVFVGIPFLFGERCLQWIGGRLDVGSPVTEQVNVVMVLGGGNETRPFVAAEIVRAGLADEVLIPLLPRDRDDQTGLTESEVMTRVLLARGLHLRQVIVIAVEETSTQGEIAALSKYLSAKPSQTAAVVTHDFHTRRTRLLARKQMDASVFARVRFVSAPTDDFGPNDWHRSHEGIRVYLLEYGKLVWQMLR